MKIGAVDHQLQPQPICADAARWGTKIGAFANSGGVPHINKHNEAAATICLSLLLHLQMQMPVWYTYTADSRHRSIVDSDSSLICE